MGKKKKLKCRHMSGYLTERGWICDECKKLLTKGWKIRPRYSKVDPGDIEGIKSCVYLVLVILILYIMLR